MPPPLSPRSDLETHSVENQPPERGDLDLWEGDPLLRRFTAAAGGGPHEARLAAFAVWLGRADTRAAARAAERHPPELRAFDRAGRRLDEVAFHPAYHELLGAGIAAGYPSIAWEGGAGGHAAHAAMVYLQSQVEPGVCCPMTMTHAAVPLLRAGALPGHWLRGALSVRYDPGSRPAREKAGLTFGMAMTEKQGGSDVRANTTTAVRDGAGWRLTGHKWFCSAPMSDAFFTLAQAPGGLSCFLVPRWTPDGARNAIEIQRLKDKLGNRANASAEIEYRGAVADLVGAEGDGVARILEMVHQTRLDTAMAPAGLMRAALSEALWWCDARRVFQKRLADQPLMAAVLADLALETAAATALGLRVAQAFDTGDGPFARVAVALAKFLSNKRCIAVTYEAMECLGGAGYVEEGPMPMLYREAPLNSIWEGSGNVICLDILRSLGRDPACAARLAEELDAGRGRHPAYDAALAETFARWPDLPEETEARWFAERVASLLAASVLLRWQGGALAEAYAATRLGGEAGRIIGALSARIDTRQVLAEAGA
ncbi:MAG: acyl-CoA dehydrogenase family protein [Rhodobacteraceae bacterium]|nr:acyl-CoA dehydrogenase family protein [Paracoccaceae bacterium]